MNKLAEMVQAQLLDAIEKDDLVLPTLPEVALSIREAAEDSEISVAALSRVIGRDAALSARLIKVVNSPLLRATVEVTELHTAITRLGINYSCNLAIGLVIEQIFHARSPAVEQKLREIWANSLEVAGMSYELARRYTRLKPDQAALGGLVNQIGALPVLIYAEEHNELLSWATRYSRPGSSPNSWSSCLAWSRTWIGRPTASTTSMWSRSLAVSANVVGKGRWQPCQPTDTWACPWAASCTPRTCSKPEACCAEGFTLSGRRLLRPPALSQR